MVDPAFTAVISVAFIAGLFMAWSIGAVAIGGGAFAPAVGAEAIPVRRAALILGVVGFFGAVLQGASVTDTVGAGLTTAGAPTPFAASIAILLSAVLMAVGAFGRYPIPAAFTVTGAMIGAGLALGGGPVWGTYGQFIALWVLAPVLVGIASFAIASFLAREPLPPRYTLAVVIGMLFVLLSVLEFSFLDPTEETTSLADLVIAYGPGLDGSLWLAIPAVGAVTGGLFGYRSVRVRGEHRTTRLLLVGLGTLVAFSGAGNQIGLAVGPLLPLLESVTISPWLVLFVASVGLVVGAWTGAPRMIEAVAKEYAHLSPSRSIAALLPAFVVAQIGVQYGVPVSFNEIIIAAIIGSGLAKGSIGDLGLRKIGLTAAAWIVSLLVAFAMTYGLVAVVTGLA